MGTAGWLKPSRQVLTIFVVVAVVSVAALAGLAWQLIDQDRDLEAQRRQEHLEQQADRVVAAMQRSLASLQAQLDSADQPETSLPPNVVAISIAAERLVARPASTLLYYPTGSRSSISRSTFAEAERLEFASADLTAAGDAYGRLADARDPEVRAGALMRLARVHRKRGAVTEALRTYASLEKLNAVIAGDLPAGLVARLGRLSVFEETRREKEQHSEASALLDDLGTGRWRLAKAQYEAYAGLARRLLPDAGADDPAAVALTEITAWLWERRNIPAPVSRQIVTLPSGSSLVLWTASPNGLTALVAAPAYLSTLADDVAQPRTKWAISHPEGRPIIGSIPPGVGTAVRVPLTSGLPWALHVFSADIQSPPASPRRLLLGLILSLVAVVLSAGWYFIFRSLARERQVARLQSDFVAAVSHEFRTPLTALSHAADLLVNDRLSSDALRKKTYQVLARDTARLRALVEGLLTFGRIEAGAAYQFDEMDVGELVRLAVEEFREEIADKGYVVEFDNRAGEVRGWVDPGAVTRALRNLLDNAVKYSPDSRGIEVAVTREAGMLAVAVRDQGLGIPLAEQQAIFDRFVRGSESVSRRIPGTGIGLAMVRQIVRAHGGDVSVSSAAGEGSVFTMRLPLTSGSRREGAAARKHTPQTETAR